MPDNVNVAATDAVGLHIRGHRGDLPTSPDDVDESSWALTDLIDRDTLQSIQDTFARVFNLPTVIVDPSGINLTNITHRLAFCEDFTRGNQVAGRRCHACDQDAMAKAAISGRPEVFHCWNGLYDCAIPISAKGEVLGYLLCGQVLDAEADLSRYGDTAKELGIDPVAYIDALGEVQIVSMREYRASLDTMHVLASMIAEQATAAIDNFRTLKQAVDARSDAAALMAEFDGLLEAFGDIGSQPDHESTLEAVRRSLERLVPSQASAIYRLDDTATDLVAAAEESPGSGLDLFGIGTERISQIAAEGVATVVETDGPHGGSAFLLAPLSHKGAVQGVAVLRRSGAPFTNHELRLVSVVMAAAAVAVHASQLTVNMSNRLWMEQLFSGLLRELTQRLNVEQALRAVGRAGMALFGASGAFVQSPFYENHPHVLPINMDTDAAKRLATGFAVEIDRAIARATPLLGDIAGQTCAVVPFRSDSGPLGFALFVDADPDSWDPRVAITLAGHAALGVDNARLLERDQELSSRYRALSELSTHLLGASSPVDSVDRLVLAAPRILDGDFALIVTLDGAESNATLAARGDEETTNWRLSLSTNARLAAVRLAGGSRDGALFESWMSEAVAVAAEHIGVASYLTEPLVSSDEFLGGLMVGWKSQRSNWAKEERRLLALMAAATAGGVSQHAAHTSSDSALKQRLADLQVLNDLAQRVTSAPVEALVIEELTLAFRDLAQLDSAAFLTRSARAWHQSYACGSVSDGAIERVLALPEGRSEDVIVRRAEDKVELLLTFGDGRALIGWTGDEPSASCRKALRALTRFGRVALDNAHLHHQQTAAIEDLESAKAETSRHYVALQRLLKAHRTLGEAVLGQGELAAMVSSLAEPIGAPVIALRPDSTTLAAWPTDFDPGWRPPDEPLAENMIVHVLDDGRTLVSVPARVEKDTLAWLVTVLDREPSEEDEAILDQGALLTALILLQETTAEEIETRLKGGFLDELLSGEFSNERIRRQALALDYDLDLRGRVLLVEPTQAEVSERDSKLLYREVVKVAQSQGLRHVVALRGARVVAVVADDTADTDGKGGALEKGLQSLMQGRVGELASNMVLGVDCAAPEDYLDSYEAAAKGLGLLSALGREGTIFSFRSPGLEHLLLRSTEPEVLLGFVKRYVEPLNEWDETHTSDLRYTLEVFYESDLNLEAAARRLHVHVSTLRYRLSRASDVLGVDLREGPTRLDVELALRAATVLESI